MKKLTTKQLMMAEIGGALVAALVAHVVIFQPMLRSIQTITQKAKALEAKAKAGPTTLDSIAQQQQQVIKKHLELRQAQLAALRERTSRVETAFLQDQDPAQLIDLLVKMSDPKKVELASVKPSDREELSPTYEQVKFEMQLKGNYVDLVEFLNRLHTVGRPVSVKQLTIEQDETAMPKLRARAVAATLYPRKATVEGQPQQPTPQVTR